VRSKSSTVLVQANFLGENTNAMETAVIFLMANKEDNLEMLIKTKYMNSL
jgi:hypothetical protein